MLRGRLFVRRVVFGQTATDAIADAALFRAAERLRNCQRQWPGNPADQQGCQQDPPHEFNLCLGAEHAMTITERRLKTNQRLRSIMIPATGSWRLRLAPDA